MKNNIRTIVWTIIVILILILHIATQFSGDVQWDENISYSIILLALGGCYEMWQWQRTQIWAYRLAFGVGLFGIFFLGWISGAIGIIGSENNQANLLYFAVPTTLLIGSLMACLKPKKMAWVLFATALVQLLVPFFALFVWPTQTSWGAAGVHGVLILNLIFVGFFAASGWLFLRAAHKEIRDKQST